MKINRKTFLKISCFLFTLLLLISVPSCNTKSLNSITLSCLDNNDLYLTLKENKVPCLRYDTPAEAINNTTEGSGVMILADGYPDKTTEMDTSLFETARKKNLRLYLEYPSYLPGEELGPLRGTHWERAVISSDVFAPSLQKFRILAIHDCHFVTMKTENPDIVIARVAGFDSAVYGLPEETFPVLSKIPQPYGNGGLMVSTTKLSQFITGRYAPADAWHPIWKYIFSWLQPDKNPVDLKWTPGVSPSFSADEPLPEDVEQQALKRGIEWYFNSRMIMSPSMSAKYNKPANGAEPPVANPDLTLNWPYGHRIASMPDMNIPPGDGSLGVMEGFDAKIFYNGTQPVRWWRRCDCNGEAAGAMSVAGIVLNNPEYLNVGSNIGDRLYLHSIMSLGDRINKNHPAYGLVGWNDVPEYVGPKSMNGYEVYYDDDNARTALGIILSASVLKTDRYDERLSKNLLALIRITDKHGFLPDRINQPTLIQKGWESYFNDTITNLSPGMQAYVWAYYLWAYNQTGFELFMKRSKNAITETMKTFPEHEIWSTYSRARMLLPLTWLIKIEDTPEHRKWLHDLTVSLNQEKNGAIPEEIGKGAAPPKSNEEYGTYESTLLQTKDDRVGDILYTVNFAFVGLHEAAMVTGDSYYKEAEDKLAKFLCRTQIRSEYHPELDGGWFRAFDLKRWEYWASSTDMGWGAWCIESGWSQSWITIVLALRQLNTSLWDITQDSNIEKSFDNIRREMLPVEVLMSAK
jgi:hypothetical protein